MPLCMETIPREWERQAIRKQTNKAVTNSNKCLEENKGSETENNRWGKRGLPEVQGKGRVLTEQREAPEAVRLTPSVQRSRSEEHSRTAGSWAQRRVVTGLEVRKMGPATFGKLGLYFASDPKTTKAA